ncbi:hypothetical protein ABBQ38_013854 [Trebouxia sp. C0009 RCD-2024]
MLEAMTRLQRCVRVNNPEPGQNCKRAQQMFSGMYNDEDMLPSFQPPVGYTLIYKHRHAEEGFGWKARTGDKIGLISHSASQWVKEGLQCMRREWNPQQLFMYEGFGSSQTSGSAAAFVPRAERVASSSPTQGSCDLNRQFGEDAGSAHAAHVVLPFLTWDCWTNLFVKLHVEVTLALGMAAVNQHPSPGVPFAKCAHRRSARGYVLAG